MTTLPATPAAGSPAISVRELTKTFGEGDIAVHAVNGIDLDVAAGEVVLVMGPSGSGKTTLLLMLGAMLRPTSGSVIIDSVNLATAPERRLPALRATHLGFIFQDFNLLSALSARENVELACNLAGTVGHAARDRTTDLLGRVGLGNRLGFRPDQLSGGEKQRVAVARALANDPTVLLADEPTANLDSGHAREIGRLLRRLATEDARSIVIVSHHDRLREVADRVLWLEDGAFRELAGMVTDPVCGMAVEPAGNPTTNLDGRTWWFCSTHCRDEFTDDPDRFLTTAPGKSPTGRHRGVGIEYNASPATLVAPWAHPRRVLLAHSPSLRGLYEHRRHADLVLRGLSPPMDQHRDRLGGIQPRAQLDGGRSRCGFTGGDRSRPR